MAGASIAELESQPWTSGLVISAGSVLLAVTALIAALVARVRDCATELIAEGRETLPIRAVQRQRRRLLTRRRTKILAKSLDRMVRQAARRRKIEASRTRPLFEERVIASVSGELRAVIKLLQKEHSLAREVALTERLITDGDSPLYAPDAMRLSEELHRIRHVLEE